MGNLLRRKAFRLFQPVAGFPLFLSFAFDAFLMLPAGSLGCGRGAVCSTIREQRPSGTPAQMALGVLLIQRRLKCSDQWLVKHIGENPYLQYSIGMKECGPCLFGAYTLVAFRKRFSEKALAALLEASVPKAETEEKDNSDDRNDPPNSGTLVLDATCCPADIAYPQDIDFAQPGARESGADRGGAV